MSFTEYEIEIDDELWESAIRASGISDPSKLANLALQEMLDRLKRQRGEIDEGGR
jgi:Arc/MetJ family transcription regulator